MNDHGDAAAADDDNAADADDDAVDEDYDAVDADVAAVDEDDDAVDEDDVLTQGRQPPLPRLLVQGLLLPGKAIAPDEAPSESQILSSSSFRLRAYVAKRKSSFEECHFSSICSLMIVLSSSKYTSEIS